MMPTYLTDLMTNDALDQAIADRYVRRQKHPTLPLYIYNYTERTQFEGAWTPVTSTCRGLIVHWAQGEVVARPLAKFYNYGDPAAGTLDLNAPAEVTDKVDGSLGIMYFTGTGWAIATRGSFTSDPARHATKVLRERYSDFEPPVGMTALFEIIYPGNRIVCDYGDFDDLVLLGAVEIATGEMVGPDLVSGWYGPQVETFPAATLGEALAMPPRDNAEGVVVRMVDAGTMVKIKQQDYLNLHRIITYLTARNVWEYIVVAECAHLIPRPKLWGSRLNLSPARAQEILAVGDKWFDKLVSGVPDEFHAWLRATVDGLYAKAATLREELYTQYEQVRARHGDNRRALYEEVRDQQHGGALMLLYDGRDITTYIWRELFPPPEKAWGHRSEDVA